jgi:hypothetical protein
MLVIDSQLWKSFRQTPGFTGADSNSSMFSLGNGTPWRVVEKPRDALKAASLSFNKQRFQDL